MIALYILYVCTGIWFIGFVAILFAAGVHTRSVLFGLIWPFILLLMLVQPLDTEDDDGNSI